MPALNQFKPGPSIGTRFGKLMVVSTADPIVESSKNRRVPASVCKCDCGKVVTLRNYVITRKRSPARSCGCTRKHGNATRQLKSREYDAWINMKTRCRRDPRYQNVTICEAWIHSFQSFLADMGECPKGFTLDRINTNGNYEPSNCRWATCKQQQNNKTNNRLITVGGITKTVSEWMDFHGLDYTTFYRRLSLGWTEEEAAGTPRLARHEKWNRIYDIPPD